MSITAAAAAKGAKLMPRPISWLPRLHEISRTVANSVRSHYSRQELERLFELQPRAAQELLKLLPSIRVGTSRLLEREILASFLSRVKDAEDVAQLMQHVRKETETASRRKLRSLVRRDLDPVSLASLPATIALTPGRLEVRFETVEQLAERMLMLARILESEGDQFAQAYETAKSNVPTEEADDAPVW